VASALSKLIINLSSKLLPETLISQSFMGHEFGNIPTNPNHLIEGHIHKCVSRYFEAAGFNYRNN
jgi:D-tagatose-1,6-bisphosphate aldolase subunit GatZ/KbaZ